MAEYSVYDEGGAQEEYPVFDAEVMESAGTQYPVYDALGERATTPTGNILAGEIRKEPSTWDLLSGIPERIGNRLGAAATQLNRGIDEPGIISTPYNILMGLMGLDPFSQTGAELASTAHKVAGQPLGWWGNVGAEVVGGTIGGLPTAKGIGSLLRLGKTTPKVGGLLSKEVSPRISELTPGYRQDIELLAPQTKYPITVPEKVAGETGEQAERRLSLEADKELRQLFGPHETWKVKPGAIHGVETQIDETFDQMLARPAPTAGAGIQKELFPELPRVETPADPGVGMKFQNLFMKSFSLAISGPGTAGAQVTGNTARKMFQPAIDAYKEIATTGSFAGAWNRAAETLRSLPAAWTQRGDIKDLIQRLPAKEQTELIHKGVYGEYIGQIGPTFEAIDPYLTKGINFLTSALRTQDKVYWMSAFITEVNGSLRSVGKKLGENISVGEVDQKILENAFHVANEMTYSANMWGWAQKAASDIAKMPVVGLFAQEIAPFPRFNFGNALRDIIDFNPVGLVRPGPGGFAAAIIRRDPAQAGAQYAKAVLGTKMIEQAARMKEDPTLGLYEVDLPGAGRVNLERLNPIGVPYLVIGELLNRPYGSPGFRVTPADLAKAFLGASRLDDTAASILLNIARETPESIGEGLVQALSRYLGRWTTFAKWGQVGQALATGDMSAVQARDIRSNTVSEYLDASIANIPGLAEKLPPRIDPLSPNPVGPKDRTELLGKLIAIEPVEHNLLKDELTRLKFTGPAGQDYLDSLKGSLGIEDVERIKSTLSGGDLTRSVYATTGDPKLNYAVNKLFQAGVRKELDALITSPAYEKMSDAQRFMLLSELINKHQTAYELQERAKIPGNLLQQKIKQLPIPIRRYLDERSR